MLDVTVVILTYNERLHIQRCLDNVKPFAKDIIVVDCQSDDGTIDICEQNGVRIVQHRWPGNQAEQFNWAIDNLDIKTEWVLRMDADEYLLPELVAELEQKLPTMDEDVKGLEFKRRHIFMGHWVKHGIYPVIILRMFRNGCGRYDNRLMDEHIVLKDGKSIVLNHDFCDHTLINVSDYCCKHINYAKREAAEVLDEIYGLRGSVQINGGLGLQAQSKHKKKGTYNRMPLFWRSFAYFVYRYILKGGFLDGKEGFLFAFIQGWWYRTLVDAKVLEVKKACGEDKEKMKMYIQKNWGITI